MKEFVIVISIIEAVLGVVLIIGLMYVAIDAIKAPAISVIFSPIPPAEIQKITDFRLDLDSRKAAILGKWLL